MAALSTNGATYGSWSPDPSQCQSGSLLGVPGAVAHPASPEAFVANAADLDADMTATCIALEAAADVVDGTAAGDAAAVLPDDLASPSLSPPPVELSNLLTLPATTLNDGIPPLTLPLRPSWPAGSRGPELLPLPTVFSPLPIAAIPPPPRRYSSSLPSFPSPTAESPPTPEEFIRSRYDDRTYPMRRYLNPQRNRHDRDMRAPPGFGPTLEPKDSVARARRMLRDLGFP